MRPMVQGNRSHSKCEARGKITKWQPGKTRKVFCQLVEEECRVGDEGSEIATKVGPPSILSKGQE